MLPLNCNRCGLCCTLGVPLSKGEIAKIKNHGYDETSFLERDSDGSSILRRVNGYCVFFSIKKDLPHCNIYEARPKQCKDFPGAEKCTFGKHVIFRISENYKLIKKWLEEQTDIKAPVR
jgi:Fe-S-cluster containining protein